MMAMLHDAAIVLRLVDYSETSQVATLFTQATGKVSVLAKGIRRGAKNRFSPGLDLLEFGECVYVPSRGEAQLGTLTQWRQLEAFLGLRRKLLPLYAGVYAAERTDDLTEAADPHPAVFSGLLGLLRGLEQGAQPEIALLAFLWSLIEEAGLLPDLSACAVCGRTRGTGRSAYFSARAPGLVCRACAGRFQDRTLLRASALDNRMAAESANLWIATLDQYLTAAAERPSQSARALLEAIEERPA